MNNKLKLLVTSILSVAVVACGNGVGSDPNNQQSLQKSGLNQSNNSVAVQNEATLQSDGKGGVVITHFPGVYNDATIHLTPILNADYTEETIVARSFNNLGESGINDPAQAYKSNSGILMPHMAYRVTVNTNAVNAKLSFRGTGALSPVAVSSIPPIFATVLKDTNQLLAPSATKPSYYRLSANADDDGNILITGASGLIVTPFYAGNLDIINSAGEVLATVKVGQYTNPQFENSYDKIKDRPLIAHGLGFKDNYLFNIGNGGADGRFIYFQSVEGHKALVTAQKRTAKDVLNSEARYWPTGGLLNTNLQRTGPGGNLKWWWLDVYTQQEFSTNLPTPVEFEVDGRIGLLRSTCVGNAFYVLDYNNNVTNSITFYSDMLYNSDSPSTGSIVGKDTFNGVFCLTYMYRYQQPLSNPYRDDIRVVSNYNEQSATNRAARFDW